MRRRRAVVPSILWLLVSATAATAADPDDQPENPSCSACTLRHRHLQERLEAKSEDDRDGGECRIKGDIGSEGKRTYFVPGDLDYERTEIETEAGEKWFCSEIEALFDGWRPAAP